MRHVAHCSPAFSSTRRKVISFGRRGKKDNYSESLALTRPNRNRPRARAKPRTLLYPRRWSARDFHLGQRKRRQAPEIRIRAGFRWWSERAHLSLGMSIHRHTHVGFLEKLRTSLYSVALFLILVVPFACVALFFPLLADVARSIII